MRLSAVLPTALIALAAEVSPALAAAAAAAATAPATTANATYWPWQTYKSSWARPPSLNITKTGPTAPGRLFFTQNGDYAHSPASFIMDDDNELVWQSARGDMSDFKAQTLDGRPVLTFFNGITLPEPWGWGYGIIQVLDDAYESIYNVSITAEQEDLSVGAGMDPSELTSYIDMHESKITPDGTILVTLINVTRWDLSDVGGPADGWVADSLFYEIDVKTNAVLFRWSSLAHVDQIPLAAMTQFYPVGDLGRNQSYPYGYFHINSVDKFADGSYLISSRFYCSIFKIARDGSVEWTLQGRDGGDFTLLNPDLSFCYQHHARIHAEAPLTISLFNNANDAQHHGVNQTTGLLLSLNPHKKTASLLSPSPLHDPTDPLYAVSQGALQLLPSASGGHHALMAYGALPTLKEFDLATGACIMTVRFGLVAGNVQSYRGFRLPWVGRPRTPPDVFACRDGAATRVYMSWLGATEHRAWTVFGGKEGNGTLRRVERVERRGFETEVLVEESLGVVQVEASGVGIERRRSEVVEVQDSC